MYYVSFLLVGCCKSLECLEWRIYKFHPLSFIFGEFKNTIIYLRIYKIVNLYENIFKNYTSLFKIKSI